MFGYFRITFSKHAHRNKLHFSKFSSTLNNFWKNFYSTFGKQNTNFFEKDSPCIMKRSLVGCFTSDFFLLSTQSERSFASFMRESREYRSTEHGEKGWMRISHRYPGFLRPTSGRIRPPRTFLTNGTSLVLLPNPAVVYLPRVVYNVFPTYLLHFLLSSCFLSKRPLVLTCMATILSGGQDTYSCFLHHH